MSELGTVIIDELIFPIVAIYLKHGRIFVEAEAHGPVWLKGPKMMRLHSPDGQLVLRSERVFDVSVNSGQDIVVTWDFTPENQLVCGQRADSIISAEQF